MLIGVVIGLIITIRTNYKVKVPVEQIEKEVEEVYIDELNLPLIAVDTLNPIFTQNKQVSDTLKLIYEPLFGWNEKNQLEPLLASEWSEKEANVWLIKLKENVLWHNGQTLTAEDVMFTYQAILQSSESVYKEAIENILQIEKLEEQAIQITLKEEDHNFIKNLTFPILPKSYFENGLASQNLANKPVGTGPYRFCDFSEEEKRYLLEANENWWKNSAFKLKKIYLYQYDTYSEAMKAFKNVKIDVISTSMENWQKKFGVVGINSYAYENGQWGSILVNTQKTLLQDSSIRRMLLWALNRENMIENICHTNAKISNFPVPSYSWLNSNKNEQSFDIEKAKQLLINAGWEKKQGGWQKRQDGKNLVLRFQLLVNMEDETQLKIASQIVENLKEIGIEVTLVKVTRAELQKRVTEGNFDLALSTIYLGTDRSMLELLKSDSTKNFAHFANEEVDHLIEQLNLVNQEETYQALEEIYKQEVPYISLFYKCNTLLTNKSVKGDITPTYWNIYHGITGWCK